MVIHGDSVRGGGGCSFSSLVFYTGVLILAATAGLLAVPKPSQATWRADWLTPQ
jgi:hypothetical protein